MENISQKPARGRPRKQPDFMWDLATKSEGRHTSHRHRANFLYGVRTVDLLRLDNPCFAWLMDNHHATLINELGRIDDDHDLIAMARYLCEHKPPVRVAVALIRAYRLETLPTGTLQGLLDALQQTLDTYLITHTTLPPWSVEQALASVEIEHTSRPVLPPRRTPEERLAAFLAQRLASD
jgi:hypothetical protein